MGKDRRSILNRIQEYIKMSVIFGIINGEGKNSLSFGCVSDYDSRVDFLRGL